MQRHTLHLHTQQTQVLCRLRGPSLQIPDRCHFIAVCIVSSAPFSIGQYSQSGMDSAFRTGLPTMVPFQNASFSRLPMLLPLCFRRIGMRREVNGQLTACVKNVDVTRLTAHICLTLVNHRDDKRSRCKGEEPVPVKSMTGLPSGALASFFPAILNDTHHFHLCRAEDVKDVSSGCLKDDFFLVRAEIRLKLPNNERWTVSVKRKTATCEVRRAIDPLIRKSDACHVLGLPVEAEGCDGTVSTVVDLSNIPYRHNGMVRWPSCVPDVDIRSRSSAGAWCSTRRERNRALRTLHCAFTMKRDVLFEQDVH